MSFFIDKSDRQNNSRDYRVRREVTLKIKRKGAAKQRRFDDYEDEFKQLEVCLRKREGIAGTEIKKEKENTDYLSRENIFKLPSTSLINRKSFKDLERHLPSLSGVRRNDNIFRDSSVDQKTHLIKLPLHKLTPLNPEQVKRRFRMIYQLDSTEAQPVAD